MDHEYLNCHSFKRFYTSHYPGIIKITQASLKYCLNYPSTNIALLKAISLFVFSLKLRKIDPLCNGKYFYWKPGNLLDINLRWLNINFIMEPTLDLSWIYPFFDLIWKREWKASGPFSYLNTKATFIGVFCICFFEEILPWYLWNYQGQVCKKYCQSWRLPSIRFSDRYCNYCGSKTFRYCWR